MDGWLARCKSWFWPEEKILAPEFSSIQEWLGRNTQAYYIVPADVSRTWAELESTTAESYPPG